MTKLFSSPVSRSVPFDSTNTSIRSDEMQAVVEELRAQTVYDPESTATTLNGTLTLSSASRTLHFITGTQTGFKVDLPNATTLFNGQSYVVDNESTASINIRDTGGNSLFEVLADSIAVVFLQSNSTANGVWTGYVVSGFATGILSYNLISSTTFTTVSTTFVPITGYTVTPVAGTYAIWFNAGIVYTTTPIYHYWALFRAGVIIADSEREQQTSRSNQGMVDTTQTVAQFNGSEALDVRYRRGTSGSINVNERSLTLIRLGP